ncbi:MAG TPA: cobalamin B12-binding domain-containing protein [Deferrisomatales bacterium]|nr:cobalamin B12-binding domain-containing protein [Deferrisomatales bacterium]
MGKKIKILIAKPGLDGHDRGAKVVALALKEAGMEVIYTGLHQSLDAIVAAAVQEDVDAIGLSILTGGHLPICRRLLEKLRDKGAGDKVVFVGGVIPKRDFPALESMGIRGIFPGGTPFERAVEFIQNNV